MAEKGETFREELERLVGEFQGTLEEGGDSINDSLRYIAGTLERFARALREEVVTGS